MRTAGLILGVVLAACGQAPDEPEATFIQVCLSPLAPVGVYSLSGQCDEPVEVRWQLPALVGFDPGVPAETVAAVAAAADKWNTWLGGDALLVVPGRLGLVYGDIQVSARGWTAGQTYAGMSQFAYDYGYGQFYVDVLLYGTYAWHEETILHELGHTLGLDHDPERTDSIMYPRVNGDPSILTAADCLAFREAYPDELDPPDC